MKQLGVYLGIGCVLWTALVARGLGQTYTFTTLAGQAGRGGRDGVNSAARFNYPHGVAADGAGNLYVADTFNHTIRKVTLVGTNWVVSTLAGLAGVNGVADGTNSAARFNNPQALTVDAQGNVYVADSANNTIRKLARFGEDWVVSTVAGVPGVPWSAGGIYSVERLGWPSGIALDKAGNLYVTDNNVIRKISPVGTNWMVSTLVGVLTSYPENVDGTNWTARFDSLSGIVMDNGGTIYVADEGARTIRKVARIGSDWVVTTIAGKAGAAGCWNDGLGSAARFSLPQQLALDSLGNLYVADLGNEVIRKLTPEGTNWMVSTVAGMPYTSGDADGTSRNARFARPAGLTMGPGGDLFVTESANNTLRRLTLAGEVSTIAGLPSIGSADGLHSTARFSWPEGVAVDSAGTVYVADTRNQTIRQITPAGEVSTVAGYAGEHTWLSADGTNSTARFYRLRDIAVDSEGNLYGTDSYTIRKVARVGTDWVVTTLAGGTSPGGADGTNGAVKFESTGAIATGSDGNLYVADPGNNTVCKLAPIGTNWVVTTVAGLTKTQGSADGVGSEARFYAPQGIAADKTGNLYVTDTFNHTIRKVTPVGSSWIVSTLAGLAGTSGSSDGAGSSARFYLPRHLAVDGAGNLYVTDSSHTIRKITLVGTSWVVSTIGGTASLPGSADGVGSEARFDDPAGIAVDTAGNLYVVENRNHTIRRGVPSSEVAPVLRVFRADNQAVVSWPLSAPGYVVETCTSLSAGGWVPMSSSGTISPNGFLLTNAGAQAVFYRLRKR